MVHVYACMWHLYLILNNGKLFIFLVVFFLGSSCNQGSQRGRIGKCSAGTHDQGQGDLPPAPPGGQAQETPCMYT